MTKEINTKTGVMEIPADQGTIVKKWIESLKSGKKLKVSLIENSKNHGSDMILISEDPGKCVDGSDDVSIWNMEISENGIFFYVFDDSVS